MSLPKSMEHEGKILDRDVRCFGDAKLFKHVEEVLGDPLEREEAVYQFRRMSTSSAASGELPFEENHSSGQ
jgi:hypothetical protein